MPTIRTNRMLSAPGSASLFASVLFIAGSCAAQKPAPIPEGTRVEFKRATKSHLQFRVTNHSTAVVHFRGTYDKSKAANPWDTLTECKSKESEFWNEDSFALVDGRPAVIDLQPGASVTINVGAEFAARYKGGLCHVSLRLSDGKFVMSNDFQP